MLSRNIGKRQGCLRFVVQLRNEYSTKKGNDKNNDLTMTNRLAK